MALEIDLSSINFSTSVGVFNPAVGYKASYEAVNPADEPDVCNLPVQSNSLSIPALNLDTLNQVCKFNFPQVISPPPVFIPRPTFNPACEDFTASINVGFLHAATGNFSVNPISTPDCGLSINGVIDVIACQTFNATSSVNIGGAAHGSLFFSSSDGPPDCGLNLAGDIIVNACEDFTATSSIKGCGTANPTVSISAVPRSAPHCGVDLQGTICVDACTSSGVSVVSSITNGLTGNFTATKVDGCNTLLSLDLQGEPVCDKVESEDQVDITIAGKQIGQLKVKMHDCQLQVSFTESGSLSWQSVTLCGGDGSSTISILKSSS